MRTLRIGLFACLSAAAATAALPDSARGQSEPSTAPSIEGLPLKRPALTPIAVACPAFPTPATPVRQQVDEANRLATLGQESSLEGDHRAARDLFSQAAALNPREASLAYRLGREYEALGQTQDAARQYCRYLSLAPNASDAPQVSTQVSHLLAPEAVARGNDVVVAFRGGIVDFDARNYDGAVTAFTKAAQDSALTDAIYNRALAHDRNGERAAAIRDYSTYLRVDPQAPDAAAVRGRIDALRSGIPSPGTAFALGLLPGGGQFYTNQPVLGVVIIAGVAGGVALALHSTTVTRDTVYTAPFGGTYPGTYTQTQHPNLAVGAGVAGGVLLLGAVEAAIVAHNKGAALSDADVDSRSALLPHAGPLMVDLPTPLRTSAGWTWQFPLRIAVR